MVDMLTLALALPLSVALAHSFVHVLGHNMCLLVTEARLCCRGGGGCDVMGVGWASRRFTSV